jgi:hypothetical protein
MTLWVTRVEVSPYLKKLVESMPQRLIVVIECGGNTTSYYNNVAVQNMFLIKT